VQHELPKIPINLPGRHCKCGALRVGNQRCEKCQARSSWYRHNCHPRRSASRMPRASTRRNAQAPAPGQRPAEGS
jgi:hypothetical protein